MFSSLLVLMAIADKADSANLLLKINCKDTIYTSFPA